MVFFVQPPQAQASPPAPLPKERVALGGDVPNPIYMLSFVSNYIQYVSLALCLKPCYYPPMFLCYSVFKTYVIEKYVFLSFRLKSMLLCLQSPCSSVSHKSLTPLGAPLCRRGARGEAVPRKRENQINTLVLKDINFTINIIDCLITERLIP